MLSCHGNFVTIATALTTVGSRSPTLPSSLSTSFCNLLTTRSASAARFSAWQQELLLNIAMWWRNITWVKQNTNHAVTDKSAGKFGYRQSNLKPGNWNIPVDTLRCSKQKHPCRVSQRFLSLSGKPHPKQLLLSGISLTTTSNGKAGKMGRYCDSHQKQSLPSWSDIRTV